MDQTQTELMQPITHAGNRLVDSLDAPALILLLFCCGLAFLYWSSLKRNEAITERFINLSEKTSLAVERLCTLIERQGRR